MLEKKNIKTIQAKTYIHSLGIFETLESYVKKQTTTIKTQLQKISSSFFF